MERLEALPFFTINCNFSMDGPILSLEKKKKKRCSLLINYTFWPPIFPRFIKRSYDYLNGKDYLKKSEKKKSFLSAS